jgi:hypothetical protein
MTDCSLEQWRIIGQSFFFASASVIRVIARSPGDTVGGCRSRNDRWLHRPARYDL